MNQMKDLDLLLLFRRIELALCKIHLLLWWCASLLLIGGLAPFAFTTGCGANSLPLLYVLGQGAAMAFVGVLIAARALRIR